MHGADQRGALDQLVAGGREEAALRREAEGVAGAADALQEGRDAARRADLADEVDAADVDAELQRGGGDERLQLAVLEALLDVEAALLREAAVVGGDVLLAEALGRLWATRSASRRVFTKTSVVRCADQLGEAVVDVAPLLVGGDGLEVGRRHFDARSRSRWWPRSTMVQSGSPSARRRGRRRRGTGGVFDRLDGGGEADAGRALLADVVEAGEGEGEVAAALVAGEGVDLVDDDGADGAQDLAAALGGEHEVERLRRGDQDVRRAS